jgi:hypothetical protein
MAFTNLATLEEFTVKVSTLPALALISCTDTLNIKN